MPISYGINIFLEGSANTVCHRYS